MSFPINYYSNLIYENLLRSSDQILTYDASGFISQVNTFVPDGTMTTIITLDSNKNTLKNQYYLNGTIYQTETLVYGTGTTDNGSIIQVIIT